MISSEVQRTLVKSPPELWAELSDPAALARHLSELGEVRITRVEPERLVEWEAGRTSGTVAIKPSGWGTKVTLSVARELSTEIEDVAEPGAVAEPEGAAGQALEVARATPAPAGLSGEAPPATPTRVEESNRTPRARTRGTPAETQSTPHSPTAPPPPPLSRNPNGTPGARTRGTPPETQTGLTPTRPGPGRAYRGTPTGRPARVRGGRRRRPRPSPAPPRPGPGPGPAYREVPTGRPARARGGRRRRPEQAPQATADVPPKQPVRRGFFARLFGGARPAESASVEQGEPIVDTWTPPPPRTALGRSGAAPEGDRDEADAPEAASAPEEEAAWPAIIDITAPEPARAHEAPEPRVDRRGAPVDRRGAPVDHRGAPLERRGARRAEPGGGPAPTARGELGAELLVAEEAAAEEVRAVLSGVLDRLGAAHHRPFSRA